MRTDEHKNQYSFNQQQIEQLLLVTQVNDYTWKASLPEVSMMWSEGFSVEEARANWQRGYDQPDMVRLFASLLEKRKREPLICPVQGAIQRPLTVDFSYRERVYRIATNEGLPNCHIVLPNGTVLVVCRWNGRVPALLADIRRSPEPMLPETIATQLGGVLAEEISFDPDQSEMPKEPRDLRIHFALEGERFMLSHEAYEQNKSVVYVPGHGYYRIGIYLESMPVKLGRLSRLPSDQCNPDDVAVALPLADAVDAE